jgi:dolichol-phosphate mannosyltransferase
MQLSVVIPVMNEKENITPLIKGIEKALKNYSYEIIFVDDGSVDGTINEILKIHNDNIKLIVFSRNFGQTSALAAGIEASEGEYIVTMDGDLQNDPNDIPNLLQKIQNDDLDLIAGIRAKRNDGFILRKIPSKVANFLIRKSSKIEITDTGCTLKILKSSVAKRLELYGELHRFIPFLAFMHGAKIAEMPVKHHSRKFGQSKYGIGRTFKVISDLLLLLFFQKYRQKPMHLFGTIGIILLIIGGMISTYLLWEKLLGHDIGHRPLFFIDIFCVITSFQFITTGFLAELLMRTYYHAQNTKPYTVVERYKGGKRLTNK